MTTVKELIDKLSTFDPELLVVVELNDMSGRCYVDFPLERMQVQNYRRQSVCSSLTQVGLVMDIDMTDPEIEHI